MSAFYYGRADTRPYTRTQDNEGVRWRGLPRPRTPARLLIQSAGLRAELPRALRALAPSLVALGGARGTTRAPASSRFSLGLSFSFFRGRAALRFLGARLFWVLFFALRFSLRPPLRGRPRSRPPTAGRGAQGCAQKRPIMKRRTRKRGRLPSSVARPGGLRFTLRLASLSAAFRAPRSRKVARESGCGLKPARISRLAHRKCRSDSQCAQRIAPPRAGVSSSPALLGAGLRIVRGGARANYSKGGYSRGCAAMAAGLGGRGPPVRLRAPGFARSRPSLRSAAAPPPVCRRRPPLRAAAVGKRCAERSAQTARHSRAVTASPRASAKRRPRLAARARPRQVAAEVTAATSGAFRRNRFARRCRVTCNVVPPTTFPRRRNVSHQTYILLKHVK